MNSETLSSSNRTHTRSKAFGVGALALVLVAGFAMSGCGERLRRKNRQVEKTPEVNSGLNALATDDEPVAAGEQPQGDDPFDGTRQQVEESAKLLEEYFAHAEREISTPTQAIEMTEQAQNPSAETHSSGYTVIDPEPRQTAIGSPNTPSTQNKLVTETEEGSGVRVSLSGALGDESAAESSENTVNTAVEDPKAQEIEQDPVPTMQIVELDPELRKDQLVDELVAVLTELAQSADDPGAPALALAGLETLRPDTLDALIREGLLSDAEQDSLQTVREMLRAMVAEPGSGAVIASPAQVADMLAQIQRDLNAKAGLAITNARLCTRVSGFGQFEPFASNTFIAGRSHRAIVYVEVDRFSQRETVGNDGSARYEVELSQRLELYHIADDLNTWNRRAETDKTSSRNRLRDYYLINQIELPSNLGVGRYNLKIVMRDLISNQAVEAIIPIEIVAG